VGQGDRDLGTSKRAQSGRPLSGCVSNIRALRDPRRGRGQGVRGARPSICEALRTATRGALTTPCDRVRGPPSSYSYSLWLGSEMTSELTATLTTLMREQPPRPSDTSTWRKGFTFGRQQTSSRIAGAPQSQHQSFSAASFLGKRKRLPAGGAPLVRQTALQSGKPLARKTPLTRRAPLARGKNSRS
jgi:hypothetical protein